LNRIDYLPNPEEVADVISDMLFGDPDLKRSRYEKMQARRLSNKVSYPVEKK
jgi:hypothetical protein